MTTADASESCRSSRYRPESTTPVFPLDRRASTRLDLSAQRGVQHDMSATTGNERLKRWVDDWAVDPPTGRRRVVRRFGRGVRAAVPGARRRGNVHRARRGQAAQQLLGPLGPRRRGPVEDRTFICAADADEAGPNNNWREPDEMRAELTKLYTGCHEGPHDVRGAVLDGPARVADRPRRRAAHRLRRTSRRACGS